MRVLDWERLLSEQRVAFITSGPNVKRGDGKAMFYVYLHLKPGGLPFYVGKGRGRRGYELHRPENKHHLATVAKYGAVNIQVKVFPCVSEEDAFYFEKRFIADLRRAGIRICNSTDGGEGISGYHHTDEARAAISVGNRDKVISTQQRERIRQTLTGHSVSAKTRAFIGAKSKGRSPSEAAREQQRQKLKGRPQTPASNAKRRQTLLGHTLSEATRKKISATLTGQPGRPHTKESKAKISAARRRRTP